MPPEAAPAPLPPRRPGFRERGQLRRRLRFLREARELGFRDLGGLVFDQHRFQRPNDALVQGKVAAIDGVDRELRVIEDVLAARRPYEELFVAGVSACPRCGALHGSDGALLPALRPGLPRPALGRGRVDRRGGRRRDPGAAGAVGPVRPARRAGRRARAARAARVSLTPVTPPTPEAPPPGTSPCPRCGELLAADQDWCLRCGDPARTVIAATPRWRRPIGAILALAAVALGVLTAAFIGLTDDDPPPPQDDHHDDDAPARRDAAAGRQDGPRDDRSGDDHRGHDHDDDHHHDHDHRRRRRARPRPRPPAATTATTTATGGGAPAN